MQFGVRQLFGLRFAYLHHAQGHQRAGRIHAAMVFGAAGGRPHRCAVCRRSPRLLPRSQLVLGGLEPVLRLCHAQLHGAQQAQRPHLRGGGLARCVGVPRFARSGRPDQQPQFARLPRQPRPDIGAVQEFRCRDPSVEALFHRQSAAGDISRRKALPRLHPEPPRCCQRRR